MTRQVEAFGKLGNESGVLLETYEAPGCAKPTPLSRHTTAALDLLTHNAWTYCVASRRRVPLFSFNLAEDMWLTHWQHVPGSNDTGHLHAPLLSRKPFTRTEKEGRLYRAFLSFVSKATGFQRGAAQPPHTCDND